MNSEWHKIFSPPSEKLTIAPGLQVDFLNCPRGMVQITEQMALANNAQVGIPIESAELLAKTLLKWSKQWNRQNIAWKRSQSGTKPKSKKTGTSKR